MSDQENATNKNESALNRAQVLFSANPLFLNPQTKNYLQAQETLFDEVEKFANAWFQRRQDATMSMINAGRRIASEGKGDLAGAAKEIAGWQAAAMQQMAEDAKECAEMMRRCAGALSTTDRAATAKADNSPAPAKKHTQSTPI